MGSHFLDHAKMKKEYGTLNNKNGIWKDIAQRKSPETVAFLIEILVCSAIRV